jgi:hypothetical protein
MRQIYNYLCLSVGDRYLVVITFILLASIKLGLWLLPFQTLIQKISQIKIAKTLTQLRLSKIIWAINIATRYIPGSAKCLASALTCQALMHHYGYTPELKIGVAKTIDGKLQAHAWVEYQGKVAIGGLQDLSRYMPLPSIKVRQM